MAQVQPEIKAFQGLVDPLEHRARPDFRVEWELLVQLELLEHPARLVDPELQATLVLLVHLVRLERLVFRARPEPLERQECKVLKDFKVPLVQPDLMELTVCLELLVPRVRLVRKVSLALKVRWD